MVAFLLSLVLGFAAPEYRPPAVDSARVTYVGNEGFLIEAGGKKVLIDALYRSGVSGYVVHPPDVRKNLERGLPPFDNVDLVLATHYHADHFEPEAVGVHLLSNRNALFVSTTQAASQMEGYKGYRNIQARVTGVLPTVGDEETIEYNGIVVRVINLHHGRNRPVENLGFLIEIGDRRFLHVGDTEVSAEELAAFGLSDQAIDFFFVPYWFLLDHESGDGILAAVGAKIVVPMHIPPKDDPRNFMADTGGFRGTLAQIHATYPSAIPFEDTMTAKTFP